MRVPRQKPHSAGINMTPMIDVVFQLIIFFLVASHFTNQENAVEVELPKAEDAEEVKQDENHRLTLSIPEAGKIYIGTKILSASELQERFRREHKKTEDAFQLRIRAGRLVPYSEVEPVLLAAAEAGIYDVQFAVIQNK